jgi:hypothetical protein
MGLSGFHVDRFIFSPTNRAISYTLKNTGESDMHPSGDILIYNGRGEEVASLKINTENVIVNAGETHVFTTTAPTAGLLGKYKAYLSMTYGVVGTSAQTQLQDTAYFYAVPWKKLLMVFVALFLFALGIALYTHKKYVADVEHLVDVDTVAVHIREGVSEAVHHDIDMKPRI